MWGDSYIWRRDGLMVFYGLTVTVDIRILKKTKAVSLNRVGHQQRLNQFERPSLSHQ